ncbi:response regulator [Noviherbaspirillum sp. UKPF54]|uniref:response regulator n=1 Tax=Noviherbaspirillum sp. UKPF54 TaxID=2601898 RepID=UPI0011B1B3F4|nr:response regulator [Noviherbaspirillum sp. UKPF54]QDZ28333.1 response regulator [Noviherbaspirillum sp. UKPF54]
MATLAPDISVKPRVLIADDSRIVRASLIKHIEGMFEFREALNGEEAWETLLIDPNIRVVITDLTMPKLDGYGLLQRIRGSKIGRIRDIPVVVVSGSDENAERERAKAAGATDLITKGIGTAQLLSRLDILSKLVATQREFEHSLEALVRHAQVETVDLPSADVLRTQAAVLLANAVKNRKNFVVLNVCVGLRCLSPEQSVLPAGVVDAIGQLLQRNVRQTDLVARTGEAEFTLATGSINFDAARYFARRVCKAIASADLVHDDRLSLIASCGVVSLSDDAEDTQHRTFDTLAGMAHRRAVLGLNCALTGIVGRTEEEVLLRSRAAVSAAVQPLVPSASIDAGVPEVPVLVQWIREGRQAEVLPHLDKLPADLRALVELALQQDGR